MRLNVLHESLPNFAAGLMLRIVPWDAQHIVHHHFSSHLLHLLGANYLHSCNSSASQSQQVQDTVPSSSMKVSVPASKRITD